MKISANEIINPIMIEQKGGNIDLSGLRNNVKKEFPYYQELKSLLEDLEYAEKKVGNERELLEAIRSLESAIKQKDETSIVAVAKKFAKKFASSAFIKVASGALVEAIKTWIAM